MSSLRDKSSTEQSLHTKGLVVVYIHCHNVTILIIPILYRGLQMLKSYIEEVCCNFIIIYTTLNAM